MKKFAPYILILIILVGLFSPITNARAQTAGKPQCYQSNGVPIPLSAIGSPALCTSPNIWSTTPPVSNFSALGGTAPQQVAQPAKATTNNALYDNLPDCINLTHFDVGGCIVNIAYYLFYGLPAFLLPAVAQFFDVIIALALSSTLYGTFITSAWVVIRDLANIFFILILLYIAIKVILGLGGHEVKKMIVQVVLMALLINFSMFFTKVVIDASNILALVFYNKISVQVVKNGVQTDINHIPILNPRKAGVLDKELAGALIGKFDPSKLVSQTFFTNMKKTSYTFSTLGFSAYVASGALIGSWVPIVGTIAGGAVGAVGYAFSSGSAAVPSSLLLGIIVISGATMLFAAYAFLIAGLSFLGRLIELWVLIIFSPFAFMSSSIPLLSGVEYIGWDSWIKKLLKTAFMAPIFMLFMYVIFKIIEADPIGNIADRAPADQTWMESMLLLIIPALIILVLLLKATKFAKEGAGQVGEAVISAAKVAGGLAIGGTLLAGATIGRKSVGKFMKEASTGDTPATRMQANRNILNNPASRWTERAKARIELAQGRAYQLTGIQAAQTRIGNRINADQHNVEHAAHARHDLDSAANNVAPGKKWEDLNGEQRYQARRQIARDRVVRDNAGNGGALTTAAGIPGFGTRKWDALTTEERRLVDQSDNVGNDPATGHAIHGSALEQNRTVADTLITEARRKQGLGSIIAQSAVTGSYDVRNLANVIAKEQSTGFAKIATGLTAALAMSMRGGFKTMGINYGEGKGEFFKDLGHTVTEALKNAKISIDLSHVGEVKKESGHGGGGHGGGGGHAPAGGGHGGGHGGGGHH